MIFVFVFVLEKKGLNRRRNFSYSVKVLKIEKSKIWKSRFLRKFMFFGTDVRGNSSFYIFQNTKKVADAQRGFHFSKTKIVEFMHFRSTKRLQNHEKPTKLKVVLFVNCFKIC